MTKLEAYFAANPTDPRVIRILKLNAKPLSQGNMRTWNELGRLIGTLLREIDEKTA